RVWVEHPTSNPAWPSSDWRWPVGWRRVTTHYLVLARRHHRHALANSDAHGGQPELGVCLDHLVEERGEDTGARAAERMPQRDGAAVGVDAGVLWVECEVAHHGQRLGRERLVEFDDADVCQRDACSFERHAGGRHRPDAHDARLYSDDGGGDNP